MKSSIAEALRLPLSPVAILRTDVKPDSALQFKEGRRGCVMFLFAGAAKGRTAVLDAATCGCVGGVTGMGFGDAAPQFPGGMDGWAGFLSSGNRRSEEGRKMGAFLEKAAGKEFASHYLDGECYKKNPELARQWYADMPLVTEPRNKYVVFRPLEQVEEKDEKPEVVVLTVNADQLSALVCLANYAHPGRDNVLIPWGAGCQLIGLLPFGEAASAKPRAIVGLTDLSARKAVRNLLEKDQLTFAMPWRLFQEMESNVPGSFLERDTFRSLQAD